MINLIHFPSTSFIFVFSFVEINEQSKRGYRFKPIELHVERINGRKNAIKVKVLKFSLNPIDESFRDYKTWLLSSFCHQKIQDIFSLTSVHFARDFQADVLMMNVNKEWSDLVQIQYERKHQLITLNHKDGQYRQLFDVENSLWFLIDTNANKCYSSTQPFHRIKQYPIDMLLTVIKAKSMYFYGTTKHRSIDCDVFELSALQSEYGGQSSRYLVFAERLMQVNSSITHRLIHIEKVKVSDTLFE